MYSWLIGRVIRSLYRKMLAGRPEAVAALAADGVELEVPGKSPLAGTYRGKAAYESWLRRFTSLGPTLTVHDVVVSGGPWNTRVAVRLTESIGTDYRNECIDYLQLRWGKLFRHEVYLDTGVLEGWVRSHPELVGANAGQMPMSGGREVSGGSQEFARAGAQSGSAAQDSAWRDDKTGSRGTVRVHVPDNND